MKPGVHLFVYQLGAGVRAYKATPIVADGSALECRHERLTPPCPITVEEWQTISREMDYVMSSTELAE